MSETVFERVLAAVQALVCGTLLVACLMFIWYCYDEDQNGPKGEDAVLLTKEGAVTALWNYQQLPMKECKWCGRTVNLNRHHAVPQAANPALRDVKENLIVLCRDCHFVLGHRCNWKRYNPDVLFIATHFTNCVRSADTRAEVERPSGGSFTPVVQPAPEKDISHVTNDVPPEQRSALERILRWDPKSQSR